MPKFKRFNTKKTLWRKITDGFKSIDMYGKGITFNYEGEETFKTHIGALVSFVIFSILFIYAILLLKTLFGRDDTSVSKTTLRKELMDDKEVQQLGYNNFMFGFDLQDDSNVSYLNDESYVTYKLKQVRQVYVVDSSGNTSTERTKVTINTKQ